MATQLLEAHDQTHLMTEVEVEVISLFVSAVKVIGLPKSVGEIYGLLFISPQPLPLDELVERLSISKGSASQGLKLLRNYGAVRGVYVAGDRRDHYIAETELKKLVAGFLHGQIKPHMESGEVRLDRIESLISTSREGQQEFYRGRLKKLSNWHTRSQELMPLITGLME